MKRIGLSACCAGVKLPVFVIIVSMLIASTTASAYGVLTQRSVIVAAFNVNTGALRVLTPMNPGVKPGEVGITWNHHGFKGERGSVGATGATGIAGPTGSAGATGPIGPQGQIGLIGSVGPEGAMGPVGPKGDKGDTGPVGPKGDRGEPGSPGSGAGPFNYVLSGCVPAAWLAWEDLEGAPYHYGYNYSVSAGEVVIDGAVITVSPKSGSIGHSDTYLDVGSDGTVDATAVTLGAAPPAIAGGHLRIGIATANCVYGSNGCATEQFVVDYNPQVGTTDPQYRIMQDAQGRMLYGGRRLLSDVGMSGDINDARRSSVMVDRWDGQVPMIHARNSSSAPLSGSAFSQLQASASGGSVAQFVAYGTNYNNPAWAGWAKLAGYKNGLILAGYEPGATIKIWTGGTGDSHQRGKFSDTGLLLGNTPQDPQPRARLEIVSSPSSPQGLLGPRMTDAQRDAMTDVPEGLEIYNLTSHTKQFFNGTTWKTIATL